MSANQPNFWWPKTIAAQLIGLSTRWFSEKIQPRLPKEAVQGEGAALRFHLPAVVKTWHEYEIEKAIPMSAEEKALFGDGDSAEMEKWRRMKRLREEIAWAKDAELVVVKNLIETRLMSLIAPLRDFGNWLSKNYGNIPAVKLTEVLDDFESGIARELANNSEVNSESPAQAVEVDASDAASSDSAVRGGGDQAADRPDGGDAVSDREPAVDGPVVRSD